MCHPLLPATKSPKHASRLGWKRTAFALLSAEQFDLRSLPGHWFATGRWSEPDRRAVDLPDRGFQHESAADIPQTGEVCFTSQLHLIQGDKLHRLEVANCGKSSKINAERPRSGNAAKTSDEAGATPPFAARCVTSSVGSLPPHQFSECTRRLSKSTGRSSFLNFHLSEDTVTSARRTRVTVAVTNAVTSDACKTTRDTEVMNRIGHGENPGMGWSDPAFGQMLIAKRPQGSLQPIVLLTRPFVATAQSPTKQVCMRTLITCACRKGKPHGNSQSSTQTTEE